jgi:signal transduction histidine kinase
MQLERLGFSPMEVIEDIVSMSIVSVPPDVDLLLRVNQGADVRVLGDPVRLLIVIRWFQNLLTVESFRFQQVVLNIVSNAVKFTEKGFILVDMYCTEKGTTSCKMVVNIEDSGIGMMHYRDELVNIFTLFNVGISQDACDKIFEPFVQADSSYARRFGGTGTHFP